MRGVSRRAVGEQHSLMVVLRSEVRDGGQDEIRQHALGRVGAAVSGGAKVCVRTDEASRWWCGWLGLRVGHGLTERHEQASIPQCVVVFRGTVGLVAEVQVRGLANVLRDVVGCVAGGFDEGAVDVIGVAGYFQPGLA